MRTNLVVFNEPEQIIKLRYEVLNMEIFSFNFLANKELELKLDYIHY